MALTKAHNRMIDGAAKSVIDFGADPTGVADSTAAFQAAIDQLTEVLVPAGTYSISQITLKEGTSLRGQGRDVTTLVGSSASAMIVHQSYKHDTHIADMTLDADGTAASCIQTQQTFRAVYDRLKLTGATSANWTILDNVYFCTFRDIWLEGAPISLNINPTFDDTVVHAVVNDNLFENIQCRKFTTRGIYMIAAAGNTFTNIEYENVTASTAVDCLYIDHSSNNKFLSNWFEPGNPTNMQRLVYVNDYFAAFYNRNNEFDNCYFVAGASGYTLYSVITGTALRTTVRNSTFIRYKTAFQNGSQSKYPRLENNTYLQFNGSSRVLQGSNADKQVVREVLGTGTMVAGTDTVDITFDGTGTDFQYDAVSFSAIVTEFASVSSTQLSLYSYKYSNKVTVFHSGASLAGSETIKFDYVLRYVVST